MSESCTLSHLPVDGRTLRMSDIVHVARSDADKPRITLSDEATARMDRSVRLKHKLIETLQPIYGVTTGFGDSCDRQISPAKAEALQLNLLRYHLNGQGPIAADDVVRATMLIRANSLAVGASGVRPELPRQLLLHLDHDILPLVPEQGSLGASGDLVPMCYVAASLLGQGRVRFRGKVVAAGDAITAAGISPLTLEAKDALALINGTPFMTGFAVLALHDAAEVAVIADICTAMTSEAIRGNRSHFDAFIHAHKPHPGQVRSAATIFDLLQDSGLSREHSQVIELSEHLGQRDYQQLTRGIQDRYSVRCAPHVTGVLHDTVEFARRWLHVEVNSANDNPLFDVEDQSVHSGGNFYGGHVAQAMDALKIALANVVDLMDRQLAYIVDEKFNHGLTPNLVADSVTGRDGQGLQHGYKGVQIAASSIACEAMKAAVPASVFSRSTEAHNQDKVSLGTIAARDARDMAAMARSVAAMHLHALCQAIDLRGCHRASTATRAVHGLVRQKVAFVKRDRALQDDVDVLTEMIRSGAVRQAVWEDSPFSSLDMAEGLS